MSFLWFGCVLVAILAFDIATDAFFDYIERTYEKDRNDLAAQLKALKRGEHLTVEAESPSRSNSTEAQPMILHCTSRKSTILPTACSSALSTA